MYHNPKKTSKISFGINTPPRNRRKKETAELFVKA